MARLSDYFGCIRLTGSGGLISTELMEVLLRSAVNLFKKKRHKISFTSELFVGEVETDGDSVTLGSLSGIKFTGQATDTNGKEYFVTFLVRHSLLKSKDLKGVWVNLPPDIMFQLLEEDDDDEDESTKKRTVH